MISFRPRIVHALYETFQTKHDYFTRNVPELTIFELASKVKQSLEKAGIGSDRPCLILAFSMGGIVAKLILNDMANNPSEHNKKGLEDYHVVFYATPHFGSDVRDDTLYQLEDLLSGMNRFMHHGGIDDKEYVEFLLDNLKISSIAKFLISTDRLENMKIINDEFKKLNMPAISVIEGKHHRTQSVTQHRQTSILPSNPTTVLCSKTGICILPRQPESDDGRYPFNLTYR